MATLDLENYDFSGLDNSGTNQPRINPPLNLPELDLTPQEPYVVSEASQEPQEEDANYSGLLEVKKPGRNNAVSSGYGNRRPPIKGASSFHNGIDIPLDINTPLKPFGNGEVFFAGNRKGYGRSIGIDYGNGIKVYLNHLNKTEVEVGDKVTADAIVGLSGNTGTSTGPHVHVQAEKDGVSIDPRKIFNEDPNKVGLALTIKGILDDDNVIAESAQEDEPDFSGMMATTTLEQQKIAEEEPDFTNIAPTTENNQVDTDVIKFNPADKPNAISYGDVFKGRIASHLGQMAEGIESLNKFKFKPRTKNPNAPGKAITFSVIGINGEPPNTDVINKELARVLGLTGLDEKYRKETKKALVHLPNPIVDRNPDGTWKVTVPYGMSSGAVELVNAYSRGGLKAFRAKMNELDERIKVYSEDEQKQKQQYASLQAFRKAHPYLNLLLNPTSPIEHGLQDAALSEIQLMHTFSMLPRALGISLTDGMDSDAYTNLINEDRITQKKINESVAAIPQEETVLGSLPRAATSSIAALPRFMVMGKLGSWALPTVTYLEYLHSGNGEAIKAALPMAVMVGSMHGMEQVIASGVNPLSLLKRSEIANKDLITSIAADAPGNSHYMIQTLNEESRNKFIDLAKEIIGLKKELGQPTADIESKLAAARTTVVPKAINFKAITPFQRQLVLRGTNALANLGTTIVTNPKAGFQTYADSLFIGLILPVGKGEQGTTRKRATPFTEHGIISGDTYTLPDGSVLLRAPVDEASGIIGRGITTRESPYVPSVIEERANLEVPQLANPTVKTSRGVVLPIDQAALNLLALRRAYETGTYLTNAPIQTAGKIGKLNVIIDQRKQDILQAIKVLDEAIPKETQDYFAKNERSILEAIATNYEDRVSKEEFVLGKKIIRKPKSQLSTEDVRPYNPEPKKSTEPVKQNPIENFNQWAKRTMVSVEESGKKGLENNKKNKGTFNAGVDPSDIPYLVQIGIGKLGRKALDAGEFLAEMVAEQGEEVRPFISEIYNQSRNFIDGVNNLADALSSDFGVRFIANKGQMKAPPFPKADFETIKNIYYIGSKYLKEAKEEEIPLNKVIATQSAVRTENVLKFGESGTDIARLTGRTDLIGNPEVPKAVKIGDDYYLFDGHHRSTADKISGKLTIKGRVIDFNDVANYQTRAERAAEKFGETGNQNKIFTQERQLGVQENFLTPPKGELPEGFTSASKWVTQQMGNLVQMAGFYAEDFYRKGIVPTATSVKDRLRNDLGEVYNRLNETDLDNIYEETMRNFKRELNEFAVMMKVQGEDGKTKVAVGIDPSLISTLAKNLYSGDLGTIIAKELLQNAADAIKAKNYTGKTTLAPDTVLYKPSETWDNNKVRQLWRDVYDTKLERGLDYIKGAYDLLGWETEDLNAVYKAAYSIASKELKGRGVDKATNIAALEAALKSLDPNGKVEVVKGQRVPLKANIDLKINTYNKTVNIVDNGIGMSPEVMTKEFADLGGTLKQAQESSGGYGIAKAAMFFNAKKIEVTSIWENPNGKFVKTKLSGSAEDWLDPERGLDFETKEIEKGKTGTRVELELKDKNADGGEVNFEEYYVNKFLKTFHAIHKLPTDLSINVNDRDITSLGDYKKDDTEIVQTVKTSGADMDIYVSPEVEQKSSLNIELLNHGLPQGSIDIYVGDAGKLPNRIVVDVKAKGFPKDDGYPWKPDRQDLRDDAKKPLEDYFKNHLVADAARKERDLLLSTIRDAVNIEGTTLDPVVKVPKLNELDITDIAKVLDALGLTEEDFAGLPKPQQKSIYELAHQDIKVSEAAKRPEIPTTHKVVDTNGSINKALVKELGSDPIVTKLSNILDKVTTNILNTLAPYNNKYLEGAYYGIGLGKKYYAINIKGEPVFGKEVKDIILYNPYNSIDTIERLIERGLIKEEDGPRELARHLTSSGVHEVTHQTQRNHYEGFSSELTDNMGRTLDAQVEAQKALTEFLEANNKEAYNAIKQQAEKVRDAIGTGENIFGKVSDASTGRELQHLSGTKFTEKYEDDGELKSSEGVRGRTSSSPPRVEEVAQHSRPISSPESIEETLVRQNKYSIEDIKKIANRSGYVNLYHGTPSAFASEIVSNVSKHGLKVPEHLASAEQMARYVAKVYDIPYKELSERAIGNLVQGYKGDVERISTAPYAIAERWAETFPLGEVLTELDIQARLYSAARERGISYDDMYEKLPVGNSITSIENMNLPPSRLGKYIQDGAIVKFEVDARAIPEIISKKANRLLRREGMTDEQKTNEWNSSYMDIQIHPQNIRSAEIVNKIAPKYKQYSSDITDTTRNEVVKGIQEITNDEGGTGTVLNSGLNPDAFLDQVKLLYKGWTDFQAFSTSMLRKYGSAIYPHLEAIWNYVKEPLQRFNEDERGFLNFGKKKRLFKGEELDVFEDNRSSRYRRISMKAHRGIYLAQKYEPYAQVYDTLRGLQRTTNSYSTTALEQLSRSVSLLKKDVDQKVAKAIFTRNKEGINDPNEDAAIIARFGLNAEQTKAYHHVRGAVSNVLDLRRDQILYREHQNVAAINDELNTLGLPTSGAPIPSNAKHLELLTKLADAGQKIQDVEEYFQELKDSGYISLQRLGRYRAELENINEPAQIPVVVRGKPTAKMKNNPNRWLVDYADSPEEAQARINEWKEQLKYTHKGKILDAKNPNDFREMSRKLTPGEFEELVHGAGVGNTEEVNALRAEVYEKYPTMGYQLRRELYPGYRENSEFMIKSVAHQAEVYASSYYNNLGRQEGLRALDNTGIEKTDRDLWNVARRFIEDETSSPQFNNLDKYAYKARKFTYLMQLGYQVKQLYLNAFIQPVTQNYNYLARVENPTTGKRLGGINEVERVFLKGTKLSLELAKASVESKVGRRTIKSPEFIEFESIYNQLKNERVIEPEYTRSLLELEAEKAGTIDRRYDKGLKHAWNTNEHWAGGFMRAGELTTRTQMAASLFAAGKKFGLAGDALIDFIVRGVDATQTNPSRAENPYYVRRLGEVGKLFYQFGAFRHMWWENLALNAKSDWKHRSIAATSRTLAPLAIVGGISGLPLTGFAFALYGLATGRNPDDKLRKYIKNKLADNDWLERMALYGITQSAGFSQSAGIQAPVLDTLSEQLTQDSWWDKLLSSNVPALMTAKQIGQGLALLGQGAYNKDFEKTMTGIVQSLPIAGSKPLRDIAKAIKARSSGYETPAGDRILSRTEANTPRVIIPQVLGIQPNEVTEFYNERRYKQLRKSPLGKGVRRTLRKVF